MDEEIYFNVEQTDLITREQVVGVLQKVGSGLKRVDFAQPLESIINQYRANPSTASSTARTDIDTHYLVEQAGVKALGSSSSRYIDIERLRNLTILDVGCGSQNNPDTTVGHFQPTFCRTLYKLGADVTGVDIVYPTTGKTYEGTSEEWKFQKVNLKEQNALKVFGNNSFDVVNADMVISDGNSAFTSPQLDNWDAELHETNIFLEALKVLKPGGLFLVNNKNAYQKNVKGIEYSFSCITDDSQRKNIRYHDRALIIK